MKTVEEKAEDYIEMFYEIHLPFKRRVEFALKVVEEKIKLTTSLSSQLFDNHHIDAIFMDNELDEFEQIKTILNEKLKRY